MVRAYQLPPTFLSPSLYHLPTEFILPHRCSLHIQFLDAKCRFRYFSNGNGELCVSTFYFSKYITDKRNIIYFICKQTANNFVI